jgi:hypothetical protein
VIVHELGHAIQDDQVPGFGNSEEGGAMDEGFGDYKIRARKPLTLVMGMKASSDEGGFILLTSLTIFRKSQFTNKCSNVKV